MMQSCLNCCALLRPFRIALAFVLEAPGKTVAAL